MYIIYISNKITGLSNNKRYKVPTFLDISLNILEKLNYFFNIKIAYIKPLRNV